MAKRFNMAWLQRLLGKRRDTSKPVVDTQADASPGPAELNIEGITFVFGMDWRMVPTTRRLSRALTLARQEGMAWYALSEMQDIVGYLKPGAKARGPRYSAPLHLASRFSQGGLELFAFSFPQQRYAVLALQDSRPLPGYDVLSSLEVVRPMIEEFLAIQRGQPIRLVGNTGFLEGQETVAPEDLFAEPVKSARLRGLRSSRAWVVGIGFVLLVSTVMAGGSHLLEASRKATRLDLQTSPAHQQKLYEEGLTRAWAIVPSTASAVLGAWRAALSDVPLKHEGWKLERLDCSPTQCKARWTRLHGSYAEFMGNLPKGAREVDEAAADQDPVLGRILTVHPFGTPATPQAASHAELPSQKSARRQLADLFLDLKLLGRSTSQMAPVKLFGGEQNPEMLSNPVYEGQWSLRQELWILPLLELPGFVRVESLVVDLQGGTEAAGRAEVENLESQFSGPHFTLTGSYYARN